MPAQTYPVPGKTYVAALPTPDGRDLYLYRKLDSNALGFKIPEYGDPHEDKEQWPDWVVSLVQINKEVGDGWIWVIYAKARSEQEAYNGSVDYPMGINAFARIVRTYFYPRAEYLLRGPLPLGTADPQKKADESAQWPGAILAEPEKMFADTGDPVLDALFVRVVRVFQDIPDLTDITDRTAAATTYYLVEYPYGVVAYPRVTWRVPCDSEASSTPLDNAFACPIASYSTGVFGAGSQYLQLIEQKYERSGGRIVGLMREYECNPGPIVVGSEYDARTQKPVRITKQIVAQSSVPATAALLNAEINGYTSRAMTSMIAGLVTTPAAHGFAVGREIFFSGVTSAAGFVSGDSSGTGAYYIKTVPSTTTFTFAGRTTDSAITGASGTGGLVWSRNLARGTIIEYQPMGMDALRSIKVTSEVVISSIDWLFGAPDRIRPGVRNYSFPDVLTAAEWLWEEAWITGDNAKWAFDLALIMDITNGYRGPCNARITERYTSNPAAPAFLASFPNVVAFQTKSHTVGVVWAYALDPEVRAVARTFAIPESLHANITIANGGSGPANATAGSFGNSIPATSPTAIPGGYFLVGIEPEQDKFGLWKYTFYEITHP